GVHRGSQRQQKAIASARAPPRRIMAQRKAHDSFLCPWDARVALGTVWIRYLQCESFLLKEAAAIPAAATNLPAEKCCRRPPTASRRYKSPRAGERQHESATRARRQMPDVAG